MFYIDANGAEYSTLSTASKFICWNRCIEQAQNKEGKPIPKLKFVITGGGLLHSDLG